jgi:hypothetical protein
MTLASVPVGTVIGPDSFAIQHLFAAKAAEWRDGGAKVVGLIGEAHALPDRTCTAGLLRDIATGKSFLMYLETPPAHTTCHLDGEGVASACATLLDQIADSDLVVLSKFGKLEAQGGGLAAAFQAAIAAGVPVLTTVSEKHREAWGQFAPDAVKMRADTQVIEEWWQAAHAAGRMAS